MTVSASEAGEEGLNSCFHRLFTTVFRVLTGVNTYRVTWEILTEGSPKPSACLETGQD